MTPQDNPLIDAARGRDEKPSEQLPCPFCGGRTFIDPVGRSWWRLYSWHKQTCLLSEVDHDVPQTEDQKQLLIDAWNSRTPLEVQQPRKPLTDEQIDALWGGESVTLPQRVNRRAVSRSIERAHGIREQT